MLARLGATVILACRSTERGEAARTKLIHELSDNSATSNAGSLSERILFMRLDLSSFKSIRDFVTLFRQSYGRLDLLVNNAAVMSMSLCFLSIPLLVSCLEFGNSNQDITFHTL